MIVDSETVMVSSVEYNGTFVSSHLSIMNVSWSDSGHYRCVASNIVNGNKVVAESTLAQLLVYCKCPIHNIPM